MAKLAFIICFMELASMINAAPAPALVDRNLKFKGGLAYNNAALTKLFQFPGNKISWMYNWDSVSNGGEKSLNYVPMLHSDRPDHTGRWMANVDKGVKEGITSILSFNEPDQCGGGGACMQDVGRTIAAHKQHIQPLASKYPKLRLSSPAVTNGVKDPKTGAPMGIPYMKAFLAGCKDCKIDFVACHWYEHADNVEYFKKHLREVHEAARKPVWLTEFGVTGGDPEKFLRAVIPWMAAQPWIERHAFFWTAPGFMVNKDGKGVSGQGRTYATV